MVFERNRSQVFTSKCGPSAMSSSSSSSRYHEVNKKEVSRIFWTIVMFTWFEDTTAERGVEGYLPICFSKNWQNAFLKGISPCCCIMQLRSPPVGAQSPPKLAPTAAGAGIPVWLPPAGNWRSPSLPPQHPSIPSPVIPCLSINISSLFWVRSLSHLIYPTVGFSLRFISIDTRLAFILIRNSAFSY